MQKFFKRMLPLALVVCLLSGCGQSGKELSDEQAEADLTQTEEVAPEEAYVDVTTLDEVELEDEAVALAAAPALDTMLVPEASGTQTKAVIDYSNTKDGYVMVKYTASTSKRLKAQLKGPTTTYTYNITAGKWETFPLSDGNGSYQVIVYENISGSKYSTVLSASFTASMTDEFAPFLRPNQYVDYENAPNTVAKAKELTAGMTDPLQKVKAVYDFVVSTLSYDKQLAATVQSGYLPVLDSVLSSKKGICFDYAAVMTAMLRSQNIPCKLVVGYAGTVYHAWIDVYVEGTGWIAGAIQFDGKDWTLMDPTFVSSGKRSPSIMEYVTTDSNYSQKYAY